MKLRHVHHWTFDKLICAISIICLAVVLVIVLKDSLRIYFKSLSLSWSLGSGPCPYSCLWGWGPGGPCPCPGPWGWGPCPYPGPCGLVLVLILVFSPYKDLFPFFRFIRIIYYIVLLYRRIQLVLIILTYVFSAAILLCVYKYHIYGLAAFF